MGKPSPVPGIGPRTKARQAAERIVRARLADVRRYEEDAEKGDEEGIHDLRVSMRRLRAALKAFEAPRPVDREAKRLQDALGTARDLQLREKWLRSLGNGAKSLADADAAELQRRLPELAREIAHFRAQTLSHLVKTAHELRPKGRLAGRRVGRQMAKRLRDIARALPEVLDGTPPEATHLLRIQFKKLRYAAEIAALARPEPFEVVTELVTPIQDALGTLHDADVRLAWSEGLILDGAEHAKAAKVAWKAAREARESAAEAALARVRALEDGRVLEGLATLMRP